MIEALVLYAMFCATTAITCIISFWNPVVRAARENGTNNTLVQRVIPTTFIYFCLSFAFAPAMFFILFNQNMSYHYMLGLKKIIEEPDEI